MTEALIELLGYLVLLCLIFAGAGAVAAIIATMGISDDV